MLFHSEYDSYDDDEWEDIETFGEDLSGGGRGRNNNKPVASTTKQSGAANKKGNASASASAAVTKKDKKNLRHVDMDDDYDEDDQYDDGEDEEDERKGAAKGKDKKPATRMTLDAKELKTGEYLQLIISAIVASSQHVVFMAGIEAR